MEQKNYIITDATSQFSQYSYVDQVYIAGDNNYNYQIEFYELSDESNAIGFYNNNAANFQARKGKSAAQTNINGKNFSKYTLSSEGKYMVVSRIDNTVIYIDVDSSYKDEVKSISDGKDSNEFMNELYNIYFSHGNGNPVLTAAKKKEFYVIRDFM